MRKLLFVFIALLFSGSTLFASPSQQSLGSGDAQFLFGTQKANIELISQNEMARTEGKFYFMALRYGVAIGFQVYRNWGSISRFYRYTGYGTGALYSGWR